METDYKPHGFWERLCELFNYCPASRRVREARQYARSHGLSDSDFFDAVACGKMTAVEAAQLMWRRK